MKIEIGYYRMRSGERARVTCIDAEGLWPVMGYAILKEGISTMSWYGDGRFAGGGVNDEFDLVESLKEKQI